MLIKSHKQAAVPRNALLYTLESDGMTFDEVLKAAKLQIETKRWVAYCHVGCVRHIF
mgnify:CR=1 FL=1